MSNRKMLYATMIGVAGMLLLATCTTSTAAPASTPVTATPEPPVTPTPTIMPATAYTVTAVDELRLPGGDVFLAPDGTRIVWTEGSRLCLYSTSGQRQDCITPKNGVDPNSVHWSPDSQRIAFTESLWGNFKEPDLWVLNANTKQLTDLTPDPYDAVAPGQFAGIWDMSPCWSGDSQHLTFVRYAGTDRDKQMHPQIFTISVDGGEPQLVNDILNPTKADIDVTLACSSAGQSIAYSLHYIGPKPPGEGVWTSKADGQQAKQVFNVPEGNNGFVLEIGISADSRYVLAPYDYLEIAGKVHPERSVSVAAIDGTEELPVTSDGPAYWATWAPTGSGMAYILRDDLSIAKSKLPSGLYVVDKPGSKGKLIYPGKLLAPFSHAIYRTFTWATNNTILVKPDNGYYRVLHLSVK